MCLLGDGFAIPWAGSQRKALGTAAGRAVGAVGVAGGAGKRGAKTGGERMRLGLLGMRMPTSARTALMVMMALMNDGLQAAIN